MDTDRTGILIVDDNEDVLRLTADILRQHGYQVVTATSGRDALALIKVFRDNLRLVLTDFQMPGMNGDELIRRAWKIIPDAAMMIMTGMPVIERPTGNYTVLQKPFRKTALVEAVEDAVRERT